MLGVSTVGVCLDVLCLFVLGIVFIYMNTLLIKSHCHR